MPADRYSGGEIAYLLGLTRQDAIDEDTGQPDSCSRFSTDGDTSATASSELDPVMAIARWSEVHAARRRVIERRMRDGGASQDDVRFETAILVMRSRGWSERRLADALGVDRLMARRRFHAALASILEELGGEADQDEDRVSTIPACMRCARRPRTRVQAQRYRVRGGWRTVKPERLSSLCVECTPPERLHLLVENERVLELLDLEAA